MITDNKMTKRYQVLSPDNISISHSVPYYQSLKQAKEALAEWIGHYQTQGYYSQTCYNGYRRQIPLEALSDYCEIITI
jgi:hypothetical protein